MERKRGAWSGPGKCKGVAGMKAAAPPRAVASFKLALGFHRLYATLNAYSCSTV
jgi:hypothetical protein